MEGQSDPALREQCYNNGATSTFTEMARVAALVRNNKSTWEKIDIPKEIPTYIQISVVNENNLARFLHKFEPQPGFLGFNLNLGCPSPKVIQKGLGCALLKRTAKVQRLIKIIQQHGYSASIKMRLGLNQFEKEKKVYLNLINAVDADFFIVHARHGMERDKDAPDWSVYKECVATGKNIIANGDITTKEQITELRAIGCKGAMIGRAAVEDPTIFARLK